MPWVCACPVMIRREASATAVSSAWPEKNTSAVSMIAKSSARNGAATSANSTAAEPSCCADKSAQQATGGKPPRRPFAVGRFDQHEHAHRRPDVCPQAPRHRDRLSNSKEMFVELLWQLPIWRGRILTVRSPSCVRHRSDNRATSRWRRPHFGAGALPWAWPLRTLLWHDHGIEEGIAVAKCDPALAFRRAAVGLAFDPAIDHHHVTDRPLHLDDSCPSARCPPRSSAMMLVIP